MMTRATVEIVGVVEEADTSGAVRVANLHFQLPQDKVVYPGQFVRASLFWAAEGHWETSHVSIFDAFEQAKHQTAVFEEPVQQVASTGTQSRFGARTAAPAATPAPARISNPAPTQQAATPPASRFGSTTSTRAAAPAASNNSVVPLRSPPPAAQQSIRAAAPVVQPQTPAAPVQAPASRFGSTTNPRPAAVVAGGSRFGNVGSKATVSGQAQGTQASARPAFNADADFDDSDIPF